MVALGGKQRRIPQDYKEAVKWFTFAAERGQDDAQYALNRMISVTSTDDPFVDGGLAKTGQRKMKALIFLVLMVFSSLTEAAGYGAVNATVLSVYDGDTFRVNIANWPPIIGENIPVRVRGLDTPEIRGKCQAEKDLAIEARDYVRAILASGAVTLTHLDRGKYFRLVATVLIDGANLTELVIKRGLGRAYDGGKKQGWCQ